MRVLRYIGVALLCIVVVLVGLVLALKYVDIDSYRGFIEGRIEAATGRDIHFAGDMRLDASLQPVVVVNDVTFSNVAGSDEPIMLKVGYLEAAVDLLPLFSGAFEVKRIKIRDARLVLEKDASGRPNWQFGDRDVNDDGGISIAPRLDVRDVELSNVEVVYLPSAVPVQLQIDEAKMLFSGMLADANLDAKGSVNDIPVTARGTLSGLWGMLVGREGQIDLRLTAAREEPVGVVTLKGQVPPPGSSTEVLIDLEVDNFDPEVVSAFSSVRLDQLGRISGSAQLAGPLDRLDLRHLDLSTHTADLTARVRGSVIDILGERKVDAIVEIPDAMPARLLPDLAPRLPVSSVFSGVTHLTGSGTTFKADRLSANLSFAGTSIDINGTVADVMTAGGLDIGIVVDAPSLAPLSPWAKYQLPAFGPVKGTARVVGDLPNYRVNALHVAVTDSKFDALIRGAIENIEGPKGVDVDFRLETSELELAEVLFKRPLPGAGRLTLTGSIVDGDGKWSAQGISGHLTSGDLMLDVTGSVGDLLGAADVRLDVSGNVDHLKSLSGVAGIELPDLKQVEVTGRITGSVGSLDIGINDLSVRDPRLSANVKGAIENATAPGRSIDLEIDANVLDVVDLGALFDVELPQIPPVEARGRLVNAGGRLRIEGLDATVDTPEFTLRAIGHINDVESLEGLDLEVKASATRASALPVQIELLPPEFGPIEIRSRLTGAASALTLQAFTAESKSNGIDIIVSGDVPDVTQPGNARVRVSVNAVDLQRLGALAGREMPSVGPVRLSTTVVGTDNKWNIGNLDALIDDKRLRMEIQGDVADASTLEGIDLKLAVDATSARDALAVIGVTTGIDQPLEFNAQMRHDGELVHVSGLAVKIGDSAVSGDLELSGIGSEDANTPLRIAGALVASAIDLASMFPHEVKPEVEKDKKERLFSTTPIPLEWVKALDIDINLTVDELRTRSLRARDMTSRLIVRGGEVRLDPINALLYDGAVTATATLDTTQSPAQLFLEVDAKGINPGAIKELRESPVDSGLANLRLTLRGRGASTAGLAASANGEVNLEVTDLKVSSTTLETLGADISLNLLRTVNPFLAKEDHMTFECGVFHADIKDGLLTANNTLGAQSKRLALVGSGVVNLATEELEFAITPKPRKGLGLSPANLARVVKVGGRITEPAIEADPKGLLKSGAKIGAALYTGGLSLFAEGMLNRIQATDNVCDSVKRQLHERATGKRRKASGTLSQDSSRK